MPKCTKKEAIRALKKAKQFWVITQDGKASPKQLMSNPLDLTVIASVSLGWVMSILEEKPDCLCANLIRERLGPLFAK